MLAEPRGPVYLTLPREVLAAPLPVAVTITSPARRQVAALRLPDPARIEEAARLLAARRAPADPGLGRGARPAAVPAWSALAEAGGIGVVEVDPTHLNFPQSHPLHVGFTQPSGTDNPSLGRRRRHPRRRRRRAVVSRRSQSPAGRRR